MVVKKLSWFLKLFATLFGIKNKKQLLSWNGHWNYRDLSAINFLTKHRREEVQILSDIFWAIYKKRNNKCLKEQKIDDSFQTEKT